MGVVMANRESFAGIQSGYVGRGLANHQASIQGTLDFGVGDAVCRSPNRDQLSVEHIHLANQYQALCDWFENAQSVLPNAFFSLGFPASVQLGELVPAPPIDPEDYIIPRLVLWRLRYKLGFSDVAGLLLERGLALLFA